MCTIQNILYLLAASRTSLNHVNVDDSLILFDGSTWDLTCQPAQYYNLFITDVWIGSVLCNFPDISYYC